nr:sensor histidine kinase [Bradyrhizobium sp. CCBAU 51745]
MKFSPDGGTVDLGVTGEGEMAVVQIEDGGPGITQADIVRIFEPFFRGGAPSGEGCGLGLSIAKRAIDQASGVIEIENIQARNRRRNSFPRKHRPGS